MKNLRIYDNGGETLDRYTIVDMEPSAMVGRIDRKTGICKNLGYYHTVNASETGAGVYMHDELHRSNIGRHLGKRVAFETLDSGLQRMLRSEFDHLNNIYTGEEQLRAMVTFTDGEVKPFTIVTKGRDKTPDCNISSTKMNIYFRTGYGKDRKQYRSLSQLKTSVTRKMKKILAKEIDSVDFHLVDEVNIF
jgi:hypothetical protein